MTSSFKVNYLPMLEVINLNFDYQDEPLLSNVSFYLPHGGLLHLRGANGAGKTTLLKLIAGLYHPAQGDICFSGQSIYNDLAAYQRQLCFVGHKTGINPNLTLRENCCFDLQYMCSTTKRHLSTGGSRRRVATGEGLEVGTSINYSENRSRCPFEIPSPAALLRPLPFMGEGIFIEELAAIFKLEHYLNSPCGLLSAGQRRQVGLLRLWMSDAKLWLLDEPLVALDDKALAIVMAKIETHREQGGTVLLTSHQQVPLSPTDYQEYCL